jgi:hypothetical protein
MFNKMKNIPAIRRRIPFLNLAYCNRKINRKTGTFSKTIPDRSIFNPQKKIKRIS